MKKYDCFIENISSIQLQTSQYMLFYHKFEVRYENNLQIYLVIYCGNDPKTFLPKII